MRDIARRLFACLLACCCGRNALSAATSGHPVYTDPARTDADFVFQGEYAGAVDNAGERLPFGVQVVALGNGEFSVVAYPGGLPGAGWTPPITISGSGKREGEGAASVVRAEAIDFEGVRRAASIENGRMVVLSDTGDELARFAKADRQSPTLGAKPPAGGIMIYDGTSPDRTDTARLREGRVSEDGLLMEGVTTRDEFGDALWHIEFRLPYQPLDRGQARGNSGAYLQGCYEVQMLDSFGIEGKNNQCGGISAARAPAMNMCLPPLAWQTYDIDFTAPRFVDGRKVSQAKMTVRHNGVTIHEEVEVPAITPGGVRDQEGPVGPLYLQNHRNPVRYRNIWVLPKP